MKASTFTLVVDRVQLSHTILQLCATENILLVNFDLIHNTSRVMIAIQHNVWLLLRNTAAQKFLFFLREAATCTAALLALALMQTTSLCSTNRSNLQGPSSLLHGKRDKLIRNDPRRHKSASRGIVPWTLAQCFLLFLSNNSKPPHATMFHLIKNKLHGKFEWQIDFSDVVFLSTLFA